MKINRYEYACKNCSYKYVEQRKESEPQYVMACPSCKGEFNLIDTVFVENEVIPEIIEEVIDEATPK
jgi:peptide subunit release factor 1 (eRF1)